MTTSLAILFIAALSATDVDPANQPSSTTMRILHYAEPRFLAGLEKEGFPADYGLRLLNSGFMTTPFLDRWLDSPALANARASGRPYYIDRITGGMPFQSLAGIQQLAESLKDDPNFLGFQVHEWDNSPLCDYARIQEHFLSKGLPFDAEQFAKFEGRTSFPYFSGGNYEMYRDVYRPIKTLNDVVGYLETYFSRLIAMTHGQVMSVNGHRQLAHTALRLGAKNVMAEIGNQVALTAFQIACVRGAARQYGKPFGTYYETWGGSPFGCTCATDFSPWFATKEQFAAFNEMGSVGPQFGSGRSLQQRLLYFAWLSGSSYWVEEWGPENYFTNWDTYPLTEYGRITKEFVLTAMSQGPVSPIVPAAVVLPPDTFGIDVGYLSGISASIFGAVPPDACHQHLREFIVKVFANQPGAKGYDAHNLTTSPWIGCFDVLSAEASPELLKCYAALVFLDAQQAQTAAVIGPTVHVFTGKDDDLAECLDTIRKGLPFRIDGEVGCVQARKKDGYLVGVFNNLGVTKTAGGETKDPAAKRTVTIEGPCSGLTVVRGAEYVRETAEQRVKLELPAGDVAVLSFADSSNVQP